MSDHAIANTEEEAESRLLDILFDDDPMFE